MSHTGPFGFAVFIVLVLLTAAILCLPAGQAWAWGIVIQLWALLGLYKLYGLAEPARTAQAPEPARRLSARLGDTLFARRERESGHVAIRLSRVDSAWLLLIGAVMAGWGLYVTSGAGGGIGHALYAGLYLCAQIFCFGVIAFLAQLYAVRKRYVAAGFAVCGGLAAALMLHGMAQHGAPLPTGLSFAAGGTGGGLYLGDLPPHAPFMLRYRAYGLFGAALPWCAFIPVAVAFVRTALHPMRGKALPALALALLAVMAAYDVAAVRGGGHYAAIVPGFAALALVWGRAGYGPLWSPRGRASRHDIHAARHGADFR